MTSDMKIQPPPLTWETLSQLSSTSTSGGRRRPFFVQQRQQREEGQRQACSSASFLLSATIVDDDNHTTFIRACPLHANNYAPTLYSLQDIRMEFLRVLKVHGGGADAARLSSSEMSMWLGMEEEDVITLGDELCRQQREQQSGTNNNTICKVYNTVKKKYQYALVHSLRNQIEERIKWHSGETLESAAAKPSCLLSDTIAQEMELTSEDVTWLSEGIAKLATTFTHHRRNIENRVLASLSGVTTPTSLDKLFDKEDLVALIIPIVKALCQQGRLPGNVSSSSSTNAVYTPDIFTYFQRHVIDSYFRTNGYITDKKCVGVGLSRNKMETFVRESFPNATLLAHSIVDPEVICHPLEGAIQAAVLHDGFADLRSSIPLDIASNSDDLEQVINGCLVDSLKEHKDTTTYEAFVKGIAVINSEIALFFSQEMSKKSVRILDPLIESYSKQRAKEIVGNQNGKSSASTLGSTADIVSLRDAATCIGKSYPDLLRLQQAYEEDSGCDIYSCLSWNPEDVGRCDGPLIEFCRAVVYADVERKCIRAVKAEVASFDSTRHGVSVSDRSVGAAKHLDVQEAFEIHFKDLCHLLQILAKTIENFSSKGVFTCAEITSMKRELLSGTGSCLARLITEYCLYKNNAEGAHALMFLDQNHNSSSSLGTSVDMSAFDFPLLSLQYKPAGGGKQKNPLQYLREILPGNSGLGIVRMWKICGGDGDDDDDNTKDADELLDQFISHLEETCLTLVGIPFSILDKKAEKRMMTLKRQGLIDRLDKSNQQDEVLSACVILIYHQTKSVLISGKTMISLVLNLFEEEKKIPKRVTEVLLKLKHEGEDVSPELLILAKKFGIAKNSKTLAAISENH
ncbi:hypothetical protein ACHAXM_001871 [Skeletonema potamos]